MKRSSKRGRPKKKTGAKWEDEYTRFCTLVKREHVAKLKEICHRESLTLKEVLGAIFENSIKAYEKKKGKVIPQPHKGNAEELFK